MRTRLRLRGQRQAAPPGSVRGTMGEGPDENRPGAANIPTGFGPPARFAGRWRKAREKAPRAAAARRRAAAQSDSPRDARRLRILRVPRSRDSLSHETHLPAKEAQARSYPRLPRPDADARGAPDAQAPARKGPQAPDGVMPAGWAGSCPRIGQGEDGCRAAPSSTVSSATAGRTPAVSSCCTCSRAATRTPRRAWACRCRARSAARWSATASSGCCARRSRARARGCRRAPTRW